MPAVLKIRTLYQDSTPEGEQVRRTEAETGDIANVKLPVAIADAPEQ